MACWHRAASLAKAVAVGTLGITIAMVGYASARGVDPDPGWVVDLSHLMGILILGIGLYIRAGIPDRAAMGRVLVAMGLTWYARDLQFMEPPVLQQLGLWLQYLHVAVLAHGLLAFPTGRLDRRIERVTVLAVYASMLASQGMRVLTEPPTPPREWGRPDLASVWAPVGGFLALTSAVAVVVLVAQRWRSQPRSVRAKWLFWSAVGVVVTVVVINVAASVLHVRVSKPGLLRGSYVVSVGILALAVLVGWIRSQVAAWQRTSVLLAQLQQATDRSLRDLLAEALEDPKLVVHFRQPGRDQYVDSRGMPASLPTDTDLAVTSVVGPGQEPLAVLVHDPVLVSQSEHRRRLRAVAAAAGLALENTRLHRTTQAHVRELISAERLTRQQIRASLHDGTQHHLTGIQLRLGQLREQCRGGDLAAPLEEIADEVQQAVRYLAEVTEGIYPSTLRPFGLACALESLADRWSVPVLIHAPDDRWPREVEETAFFLISEAVGNACEHGAAGVITVRVRPTPTTLLLDIAYDGYGGADDDNFLHRMREGVAAQGGTVAVHRSPAPGTTVQMELPCGQ